MNELGVVLIGIAARATAFACLGWGVVALIRRWGPAASAMVAMATLVGMVGVAAIGAGPGLRLWSFEEPERPTPKAVAIGPRSDGRGIARSTVPEVAPEASGGASDPGVGAMILEIGRALMRPAPGEAAAGWGWRAWLAAGAMAGVAFGLARFAVGLAAVAAIRQGSRPVEDPGMVEAADRIRAELGIGRAVGLRVAPGIASPATIGWRRPLILLPVDWAGWDDRDRRVVLAHELAHIARNDYLSGWLAQLSLAIHYYNPMAHRLASRLRLDQELAADAIGAGLSGGKRPYLATLARLALRSDPRPAGWPARSFRPDRGTFLRRIEMLRDTDDRTLQQPPLPRRTRLVTLGTLALAAVVLAGLRGPAATRSALAATPQEKKTEMPGSAGYVDFGYIPGDVGMLAMVRPAELHARPEFARLLAMLEPAKRPAGSINLPMAEIEQVTIFWDDNRRPGTPMRSPVQWPPTGTIVRATKPQDWKAVVGTFLGEAVEAKFGDRTYHRSTRTPSGLCYATPDDRTLVIADEAVLLRMLDARPGATDRAAWSAAWKGIKKGQAGFAVDTTWLRIQFQTVMELPPGAATFGGFAPLIDRARGYAVGITAGETLAIDGMALCGSDEATKLVADTLRAGITLLRNQVEALGNLAKSEGRPVPLGFKIASDLAVPLLAKATVTTEGQAIRFGSTSDLRIADVVGTLIPAVVGARGAAKNVQSVNNLKQIGLAMHNYAAAKGKFPPAIVLGPDGKTPHSWRVEILPFLEQQALFNEYQMNEPWDSVNNRKVLEHMPDVFRHPDAAPGFASSYYVFTGKGAMFQGHAGTPLETITDGVSSTIMAVEAAREIPWTKPEDIPFDPEGAPPKVGGFAPDAFNALFADGSVKTIKATINPITLKALITRASGEAIASDSY